ncbi:hypothetical protein M8J76_009158 [Diaphorina citri]|nr:hypothetical protein M8J76_009158 [Diaphorina citri]
MAEGIDIIVQVLEEIKKMRGDFNESQKQTRDLIEEKYEDNNRQNKQINEKIEKLEKKINTLEKESKKRNIVVYGIKEGQDETYEDLREIVRWFLNDKMQMGIGRNEVDNFFRLGKRTEAGRDRPILIKFVTNCRKREVVNKKGILKRSKIFIENDLCEKEEIEKKNLVKKMKELRASGHHVIIRGKSLIVNGERRKEMAETQEDTDMECEYLTDQSEKKRQRSPEVIRDEMEIGNPVKPKKKIKKTTATYIRRRVDNLEQTRIDTMFQTDSTQTKKTTTNQNNELEEEKNTHTDENEKDERKERENNGKELQKNDNHTNNRQQQEKNAPSKE